MKITKQKYEKAVKALVKLRQAEHVVNEWEQAKKDRAHTFATEDVTEIERVDGVFEVKSRPKDAQKRPVS